MPIHSTAIIDPTAKIHPSCRIGPYCVIGADVELGKGCHLVSHVVVEGPTKIGTDNGFFPFSSIGLAPLAVGLESSPEAGQLILPAENAGLVGLKPTVGLVSATGVLPVAKSQDAVGPIAQTVTDAAIELEALSGKTGYTTGLKATALEGDKVAVVPIKKTAERSAAEQVYVTAENAASTLEATNVKVTPGTATTAPSVVPYEFHRDLDTYLGAAPDPGTGIRFDAANGPALLHALERAVALHRDPIARSTTQLAAMARDSSWTASAQQYVQLYRSLVAIVGPGEPARQWLTGRNTALGECPIDLLRTTEGIMRVLYYVDAYRGRI